MADTPPPELLQLAEPSSILRALECPICTNIALPPLILCEHGHFVCESCRTQTDRCGLCKGSYTSGRNIAIEQIVRASVFSCRFQLEGCQQRVLGDEYKAHLTKCGFRNITCNCYYGNHCQGVSIGFNKYIAHLLEHHKFERRTYLETGVTAGAHDGADGTEGVTTLDFTSSMRGRVFEWTPMIIEYRDKFFIARRRLLNGLLTIWVSLFGGGGDFHTEITVANSDASVLVPRVQWTVAVHSCCRKDWAEIDDSFLCVTVPFQQLKQIGSRSQKDGKLAWAIRFKIRPNCSTPRVNNLADTMTSQNDAEMIDEEPPSTTGTNYSAAGAPSPLPDAKSDPDTNVHLNQTLMELLTSTNILEMSKI